MLLQRFFGLPVSFTVILTTPSAEYLTDGFTGHVEEILAPAALRGNFDSHIKAQQPTTILALLPTRCALFKTRGWKILRTDLLRQLPVIIRKYAVALSYALQL